MAFVLASFRKDLQRRLRDPVSLGLSLGLPLIIGLLLNMISSDGGTPTAHLLVADHDESFVSGLLVGSLQQGPLKDLIRVEAVDEETGRARMDDGDASGLLVIPAGFGAAVLDQSPSRLDLITNPAQRILPGIIQETLATILDGATAAQRVLGPVIRPFTDNPPSTTLPDQQVAATAVAVNQLMDKAIPLLLPPAIQLETEIRDAAQDASGGFNFAQIFFPSMFFLAILFMAQGTSDDLWVERQAGTLRRVVTTPQLLSHFLLGKLLATALVIVAVAAVGWIAGRWVFGIELANFLPAVAWAGLSGTMMLLLFTLVQILAGTQRGGNVLVNMIFFPMIMLGGSFFPFEAMPEWLAAIGRYTPNGWALIQLKSILMDTFTWGSLLQTTALLLGISILLLTLLRIRVRSFAAAA